MHHRISTLSHLNSGSAAFLPPTTSLCLANVGKVLERLCLDDLIPGPEVLLNILFKHISAFAEMYILEAY